MDELRLAWLRAFSIAAPLLVFTAACGPGTGDDPPDLTEEEGGWAISSSMPFRGVNLSSAEFGESSLPGTYGTTHIYPTISEVEYFMAKGMTTFRLPFRWERIQRSEGAPLDAAELGHMDEFVQATTARNAFVVLDPHNYARYYGRLVGSEVSSAALANLWGRLAAHYKSNPRVIFGLMNEPHDIPTEQWASAANDAIAAIRTAGAQNLVLVPGNAWTGAHAWDRDHYGTPNAVAMLSIRDPGNNYAFEVHQYLDGDSSGTAADCVSGTIGSERMKAFTGWLRDHRLRGVLGEFGGSSNALCMSAMKDILTHLHQNSDLYLGWIYWAAGPWWGDYFLSIEPKDGADRVQLAALRPFLDGTAKPSNPPPSNPPPSNPPPSNPPPSNPPPSNPPTSSGARLETRLRRIASWDTGFCVEVRISNQGNATTSTWQVTLQGDFDMTQKWNTTVLPGNVFTPADADWSRSIPPGGSTSFGLCADIIGPNPWPTVVSVSG